MRHPIQSIRSPPSQATSMEAERSDSHDLTVIDNNGMDLEMLGSMTVTIMTRKP
jgi:hypothetical protein